MKLERTMENLTWDDLCDLMCGAPEEDPDDTIDEREDEEERPTITTG